MVVQYCCLRLNSSSHFQHPNSEPQITDPKQSLYIEESSALSVLSGYCLSKSGVSSLAMKQFTLLGFHINLKQLIIGELLIFCGLGEPNSILVGTCCVSIFVAARKSVS